jgi:hypothetical protein
MVDYLNQMHSLAVLKHFLEEILPFLPNFRVIGSIVLIVFLKNIKIIFFYFLKIIFNINTLKRSKNINKN